MGYRVNASPGTLQTWIRGAADYSSSRYVELDNPKLRAPNDYGLFLLADHQFLQTAPRTAPGSSIRGIYAGASVEFAPSYFNRFSRYFEGRIYGFGLIPGRPFDLASLVATENVFSGPAVAVAKKGRLLTHDDTQAITASYSAHVLPGINLNVGLTYTTNPTAITYTSRTGSDLNVIFGTVIFL